MQHANDITTMRCDVVIAGCGVAGLYTALQLPASMNVVLLTKTTVDECDSMLAQGGICVQRDEEDFEPFYEDTMRAGHYENRPESVAAMIHNSRAIIDDLVRLGVEFERDVQGNLAYTREGAHSKPRICYHADTTGKEITTKLLAEVRRRSNIKLLEHVEVIDVLTSDQLCAGVSLGVQVCTGVRCVDHAAPSAEGEQIIEIYAPYTVLATGGIGGTYERSTNFPSLTGDACRIAGEHGIALEHMDYVQIHPTSLYTTKSGRAFLISESCRGEGAVLLDAQGKRFTDELQPRDVVSAAIYDQMKKDGTKHVWLSFEHVPREEILNHFVGIRQRCLEEGYDILSEPIPVVPAQHYFMGGVWVDQNSETSMPCLYAVGETSCNGVHGKNRLASNSLLEALVFARIAATDIAERAEALGVSARTNIAAKQSAMLKEAC